MLAQLLDELSRLAALGALVAACYAIERLVGWGLGELPTPFTTAHYASDEDLY